MFDGKTFFDACHHWLMGIIIQMLILGIVTTMVILYTGWPNRLIPLDDSDHCPVIYASDNWLIAQDKVKLCNSNK